LVEDEENYEGDEVERSMTDGDVGEIAQPDSEQETFQPVSYPSEKWMGVLSSDGHHKQYFSRVISWETAGAYRIMDTTAEKIPS
jgi:hypothetical protein